MKKIAFLLLLSVQFAFPQDYFGINFPGHEREQICGYYNQLVLNKPKEVRFSIVKERGALYFETNDNNWLAGLFKGDEDGIAIDLVMKDRYECSMPQPGASQIRGRLLKPVYAKKLRSTLKRMPDGKFRTFVGRIPSELSEEDLEYNILFLNDKNLCLYYVLYDLETYPWDLLDMGMYLDSLTYANRKVDNDSEGFILRRKEMKFKIPFEKNKSLYSNEDIRPIYDSLRLTNYNIKRIDIKAYASVEGSLERNLELQKGRAKSISSALQSFQEPEIVTSVSSSENWVDFLNDIEGTSYDYLKDFGKAEIKKMLVGELVEEMEPILSKHRLAVLQLELERKDIYINLSTDQMIDAFNKEIRNGNSEEAAMIQNSIFDRIREKVVSPDYLDRMSIPRQLKFLKVLNKNSAFRFMTDIRQGLIVYDELKRLEQLDPANREVKYNLVSVALKLWRYNAIQADPGQMKQHVLDLKQYGVTDNLISRMLVNFNIILAEQAMRQRDYKTKDRSIDFILKNYGRFELSDFDYLSLAQFFSYYGDIEMSVDLLKDKARTIEIDEDLLFYYINLTLTDTALTQTSEYRTIMLNAFNLNRDRYCRLFDTFGKGGVTFQLLEDPYLRNSFCENCLDR